MGPVCPVGHFLFAASAGKKSSGEDSLFEREGGYGNEKTGRLQEKRLAFSSGKEKSLPLLGVLSSGRSGSSIRKLMKRDSNNVFQTFRETFGQMKGHLHVLEQQVPVERQMEYFKYSGRIRRTHSGKSMAQEDESCEPVWTRLLQEEGLDLMEKRYCLCYLATSKSIKAYRMLEEYAAHPDPEVADWACLALMEARITLESDLSDEQQIYVSTGLGGKGHLFRFYLLLLSRTRAPFEEYQRQVIEREITYALAKEACEIERLSIADCYVEVLLLFPMTVDLKQVFERIIDECNQYGNFLSDHFRLTNVAELSKEEIQKIIDGEEDEEEDDPAGD